MQILVIRDAQTPVRQIEVTPWRVFKMLCLVVLLLIILNSIANWILETLGWAGATQNHSLSDAQYERKLVELEVQLAELNARLKGLDATRQQMLQEQPVLPITGAQPVPAMVPPQPTAPTNAPQVQGGQGGPMVSTPLLSRPELSFATRLHQMELASLDIRSYSERVSEQLTTLQQFKMASPTGYPLPYQALVTSAPGYRMDPFTGRSSWHAGTDYGAYPGTPILATGDGYVIRADWDEEFGNFVEISHPGVGLISRYAHAQDVYVKLGQRVVKGEVIASVGSTGRSTGPHLHYEIR
jgi:murein DD-endopeptidase MepM/ murein hydrolase activator NlpD